MQNVRMTRKGDVLTIVVDLSQTQGPSASGKSIGIASTRGNVNVEGSTDIKMGLNVYKLVPKH